MLVGIAIATTLPLPCRACNKLESSRLTPQPEVLVNRETWGAIHIQTGDIVQRMEESSSSVYSSSTGSELNENDVQYCKVQEPDAVR